MLRHPPSAESLRLGSSASTRKGSLVGVEHLPPMLRPMRRPMLRLMLPSLLEPRLKFARMHPSVPRRLVPHRVRQVQLVLDLAPAFRLALH
jgi:hypothetical protein